MNCAEAERWWGEEAAGTAPPDVRAGLEAHAAACPSCRRERAAYARLEGLLTARLKAPAQSAPSLAASVRRVVQDSSRRRETLRAAAALAAALLLAAAVWRLQRTPTPPDSAPVPPESSVAGPKQPRPQRSPGTVPPRHPAAVDRQTAEGRSSPAAPGGHAQPSWLVVCLAGSEAIPESAPRRSAATFGSEEPATPGDVPQTSLIVITLAE